MQIYTGDSGKLENIELQKLLNIGTMLSASSFIVGRPHHYELPIAVDNGAFSAYQNGYGFDEYAFLRLLSEINRKNIQYDFIVVPDIVASEASLDFSLKWLERLAGWKRLYLAVQDGMDERHYSEILSAKIAGIFVGGTEKWKWQTAERWVKLAHENGLKCHIGRCGTFEKLLYAYEAGADSVDSTNFARNGNYKHILSFYHQIGFDFKTHIEEPIEQYLYT